MEQEAKVLNNGSEQVVSDDEPNRCRRKYIDEILATAGPYGLMQVIVHVSMFCLLLAIACHIVLSFFTGHSPSWRCNNKNSSSFCEQYYNRTISSDSDLFNHRCYLNRSEWTYNTDRDYSLVTEFDLICDKACIAAVISACYFIGCVLGAMIMGPVGDAYGRKSVILVSAIIVPIPTISSSYINAIWELCGLNVIRGISSTCCIYTPFVYLSEVSPPAYRSASVNIAGLMGALSIILIDLLAYYVRSWRHLSTYVGVLVIPIWVALFFLPESPRWLASKGKKEEAECIIGKIIQFKGKIKACIRVEATQSARIKKYTYIDLIRNCQVLRFTSTIVLLWSVLPVLYYSITVQSMNYAGDMYVNYALTSLADIPGILITSFLNDRIGRKKTNLGGCFASGFFLGSILLIPKSLSYRHTMVMILTSLARLTCATSFYGVIVWTAELFPTVLRAQGLSICTTFEKLAMITVPFVTTLLQSVSYNLPIIVMCVIGILASIAGLSLPETNKQPTRENYEEFFRKSTHVNDNIGVDNVAAVNDEHML